MDDSHEHSRHEFGRTPSSGSATVGFDGPVIGASTSIIVDGLTEDESGVTPPPPPFSLKAAAVGLAVMFVLGVLVVLFVVFVVRPAGM